MPSATFSEWRWAWLAEFEISCAAPFDRYRVLVQVQRDMLCVVYAFTSCDGLDMKPHGLLTQCEICG